MITEDFPIKELFGDLIWVECIILPLDNSKLNLEIGKKYGFLSKLEASSTTPSRYVDEAGTQVPAFYFKLSEAPQTKTDYAAGERTPHDHPAAGVQDIRGLDVMRYARELLGNGNLEGDITFGGHRLPLSDLDLDDIFSEL